MPLNPPGVSLPPLKQIASPNHNARAHRIVPYLIVLHRPVGSYASAIRTLTDPNRKDAQGRDARVSAHIVTDSNREATQLVAWDRKAWTAGSFNSASYNLEVDDDAWTPKAGSPFGVLDPAAFMAAARITAFLCKRTGIPPAWTREPLSLPGITRHYDLGRAGGGHTDPTTSDALWRRFVARVAAEYERGQFRPVYGAGALQRIDT